MKVFGVVGWKNNGKTTLVERLISQLTSMGYKVSSVKHAHHNVDIDEPGRDSYRHRAAGAKQTLLATQHRWALMREHREQDPPNLEQLLPLFEPCDIVIVEGYKGAAHPKLEIIRHLNKEGLLADQMPNIVALVTDQPHLPSDLPQLDLNNIQQITDFVLQHTGLVTTPAVHEVNDCYSPAQQLQTAETVWQGMQALASTQVKSQTLALD
ncbi:MAG: molybdopterin-guanine dinucleotide biosynthesis protein B, partial [Oceanospirillaceae bacterium]|nr:molybdopterin-guanine dinucleotide biosynthesis protein B [Oceanospirillaceae bacterium]